MAQGRGIPERRLKGMRALRRKRLTASRRREARNRSCRDRPEQGAASGDGYRAGLDKSRGRPAKAPSRRRVVARWRWRAHAQSSAIHAPQPERTDGSRPRYSTATLTCAEVLSRDHAQGHSLWRDHLGQAFHATSAARSTGRVKMGWQKVLSTRLSRMPGQLARAGNIARRRSGFDMVSTNSIAGATVQASRRDRVAAVHKIAVTPKPAAPGRTVGVRR